MALTLQSFGAGFPEEAISELLELQNLIGEQRRLLTEEAGFREVEDTQEFQRLVGEQRAIISGRSQLNEDIDTFLNKTAFRALDQAEQDRITAELQTQGLDPNTVSNQELRTIQQSARERINEAFRDLEQIELEGPKSRFEKTPERLEQERRLDEFRVRQEELLSLQLDRQQRALRGELPVSEATQRAKQEQFEQFKEAQARIGNVIVGDTPETAAARGTGAEQALQGFREQFGLIEEAERRGEITQGAATLQASLSQVPTFGAGFARAIPGIASPLGLQSTISASSPFFQQQSLDLQRRALENQISAAQQGRGRSGLLGAAGGLVGGGLGALLAAPTGGLSLSQGALLGNLFGTGTGQLFGAF